jgi:hypothetical protein
MAKARPSARASRTKRAYEAPGVIKVILTVVLGLLGLVATEMVTFANVTRSADPSLALKVVPFDARAKAIVAVTAAAKPQPTDLGRADVLARSAIERDGLSTDAMAALALSAAVSGDVNAANRRFLYVDRLTRRSLLTQLWFIERSVEAGDIPGALWRYDIALRVHPESTSFLFPVMNNAVSEPQVARALNRLLLGRPSWGNGFLLQLIAASKDAHAIMATGNGLIEARTPEGRELLNRALTRFVMLGDYDDAWIMYERAQRGIGVSTISPIRDGGFSAASYVGPFEWVDTTDPELLPERRAIDDRDAKNALFLPTPSKDGIVSRQILHLPAGSFNLTAKVGGTLSFPDSSLPQVQITCDASGRSLASWNFPQNTNNGTLRGVFTIPADCAFQSLNIIARAGYNVLPGTAAEPWITGISIRR